MASLSDSLLTATSEDESPKYVTRNIEDLKPGDLVLAREEHGNSIEYRPIKEVYRRTSYHLRHLTFETKDGIQQKLETTNEHPFWSVTDRAWIDAGDLKPGTQVTSPTGVLQTLAETRRTNHPEGIPVFNFQVEDFHTYFVSETEFTKPLLVHNADYAVPAYIGSATNPVVAGKPTKNVDELIDAVENSPKTLKGSISPSEDAARKLAEEVAEKKGVSPKLVGPEAHGGGMNHFHIEEIRKSWHFWF